MRESKVIVVYDIENNRARSRIFEACKDYGLSTVQYSVFCGSLSPNRAEGLFLRMKKELDGKGGYVLLIPVCDKDFRKVRNTGAPLGVGQVTLSTIQFE